MRGKTTKALRKWAKSNELLPNEYRQSKRLWKTIPHNSKNLWNVVSNEILKNKNR